ncbi:MAG TPA: DUF1631 family protein [Oleiagrimonas sp.]|nr:DUF1631 family protein [Oleiagrimonas sp.]
MKAESSQLPGAAHAEAFRFVRGQWPTRTCRLMDQLHGVASDWLRAPLHRTLDDFAARLFELGEHARSGIDLQSHMGSREKLLQARQLIDTRFMQGLGDTLNRIGKRCGHPETATTRQPLSLVVPAEQEMSAALDKVAARGVACGGSALFELDYRLAVLIGSPPLEGPANPLGPHALATSFHDAIAPLDLTNEHKLQLLACFDRTLLQNCAALYEQINRHLLADGILPCLQAYSIPAQPARAASADAPAHDRGPTSTSPSLERPTAPDEPIAVLDNLRELLAQRHHGQAGDNRIGGSQVVTTEALQTALGALQQHFTQITEHASRELRSAQRLRKELLSQLDADQAPDMPPAQLSREQDDTIELVAMLFEQLAGQVRGSSSAHTMLGQMQIPMLRMAIADHDFFEQREHPARRVLDTVAEVANDWLDTATGEPDRGLETRLEQLIERANREPPSAGLYTSLLADIEQNLNALKLRADAAERRHVETMRARERLDRARARATELMNERFARSDSEPHGLLRALLDRAWTDVLSLTLLRHEEHDPEHKACLAITDQLLGLAPVSDREQLQQDVQAGLHQIGMADAEASQVAQRLVMPESKRAHDGDAPSTTELLIRLKAHQRLGGQRPAGVDRLGLQPVPAANDAPDTTANQPTRSNKDHETSVPPATAPPVRAASPPVHKTSAPKPHASKPGRSRPASTKSKADPAADDPRAASLRRHLRALPFGTWFEFTNPASGRVTRHKLAWYSPMSGQALFVTRRGQRGGELSLDELAAHIAKGQVREVPVAQESLLDRAWRNLTSNLHRSDKPPFRRGMQT